jgi:hypothetical protein
MKVLSDKNSLCLLFASSCSVLFLHLPSITTLLCARIHHQSWLTFAEVSFDVARSVVSWVIVSILYIGVEIIKCMKDLECADCVHVYKTEASAIVGVISSARRLSNNDLVTYRLLHISSSDIDEKCLLWE